jgi:hypothetical protein
MNDQEPISPRRRMQMLLAIPEGERTDAEWDELNELEISLSPVNRVGAPEPVSAGASARKRSAKGPSPARSKPQKPLNVEKPAAATSKKPFRRSPRRRTKGGGGAGGGGEGPQGDAAA